MSGDAERQNAGKGLGLIGLVVGLLTGAAVYGIVEFWLDDNDDAPLPYAVLFFTVTASAAFLLLSERTMILRAALGALAIAAVFIIPDYHMAGVLGDEHDNLSDFPALFWLFASRGLVAYLLVTLLKSSLEDGAPPPYRTVFFHGLTLPPIAAGAGVIAVLALILLFVWARLMKEMDVAFFNRLFQEPWFILPFLGAVGGLSISLMRAQNAALGGIRSILLLVCRILMPIAAALTVTFLLLLVTKGVGVVFERTFTPAGLLIALAIIGMLLLNGVYQNGEGAPPSPWLRLSAVITLIGFPVYAGLALYAFWLRIEDYGLTPARIAGLTVNGLVAAYSIVCLAGLLTEANWNAKRWMPVVAPLNTAFALLWIVVLIAIATPFFNPWAMSANSQYRLLADGKIAAKDFDFAYLRFQLGRYGEKTLDDLASLSDHPEAQAIRDGVARARAAKSRWDYEHPETPPPLSGEQ